MKTVTTDKRRGVILLTPELLEQLLHLPEGYFIHSVRDAWSIDGVYVCIVGPGLAEVPPGTEPVHIPINIVRIAQTVFHVELEGIVK